MEIAKLAVSVVTPIVVAIIGVLLLRRIEGVKALVASQSEFNKKWAEEFFDCCQRFMQTLERELALLTILTALKNPDGKFGTELQEEINRLNPTLSELELRIRRSVVFAQSAGGSVTRAAHECVTFTGELLERKEGNLDDIINEMNNFNIVSRRAHAEILGLNPAR